MNKELKPNAQDLTEESLESFMELMKRWHEISAKASVERFMTTSMGEPLNDPNWPNKEDKSDE